MCPQVTLTSRIRHNPRPMPNEPRDTYSQAIATRIAAARRLAGMSQRDLAKALQTHERTVRALEAGDQMPAADLIGRLAVLCRRSCDWILGRPDGDFACLIDSSLEGGLLLHGEQDEDALIRALRLSVIAGEAVESIPLRQLSRRLAAVAQRILESRTNEDKDHPGES